jgi:hypothetical protein
VASCVVMVAGLDIRNNKREVSQDVSCKVRTPSWV